MEPLLRFSSWTCGSCKAGCIIPFSSYFQAFIHSGKHRKSFSKTKSLGLGILYYCYSNLCVIAVSSSPIDFNKTISYTRASNFQIYGFLTKYFQVKALELIIIKPFKYCRYADASYFLLRVIIIRAVQSWIWFQKTASSEFANGAVTSDSKAVVFFPRSTAEKHDPGERYLTLKNCR